MFICYYYYYCYHAVSEYHHNFMVITDVYKKTLRTPSTNYGDSPTCIKNISFTTPIWKKQKQNDIKKGKQKPKEATLLLKTT